jgi:hypothetical protein
MFSVELELLFDNPKWFLTHFTLYSPVQDIIWDTFYSIWKFLCRDDLINLREWSLIVRPVEERSVDECSLFRSPCEGGYRGVCSNHSRNNPLCLVSLSISSFQGSFPEYLFSTERIILIRYRLIVPKWTHARRKKLSPFSIRYHFLYDTRNKRFVFFFGILAVEDAVGSVAESST